MPRRSSTSSLAPAAAPEPKSMVVVGRAFAVWAAGWVTGNVLASLVIAVSGQQGVASEKRAVWIVGALAMALWGPQIGAVILMLRSTGLETIAQHCRFRFAPIDLLGVPIGVASQFLLLRAVYAPLRQWWPNTFTGDKLEQNARELYERAQGGWLVMLTFVVVIGAPIVEELIYRGVIQTSLMKRFSGVFPVVLSAAFFALIHFRPIEFPGLFAFGLVLGSCLLATKRIGMSIVAHMAFNAAALITVAR